MDNFSVYDCIVVGAGPGGLSAAIYLGRYNRRVLILDRGGGRTTHARHIENFFAHDPITGEDLIKRAVAQAERFGAEYRRARVTSLRQDDGFVAETAEGDRFATGFVVASTGARENLPVVENLPAFFGTSFFTCVDCDGYRTTGKKLTVLGRSPAAINLAMAMKQMYTNDISVVLTGVELSRPYRETLAEERIEVYAGKPVRLVGTDRLEALELDDGRLVPCEVVMADYGFSLNDSYLAPLGLKKDGAGPRYAASKVFESSVPGLFLMGPLKSGRAQAVIAAGEGAVCAIEINRRLIELSG